MRRQDGWSPTTESGLQACYREAPLRRGFVMAGHLRRPAGSPRAAELGSTVVDRAAIRTPADADRLRLLVDAGISLSSELSLDALLQRIVETAAQLTGATLRRTRRRRRDRHESRALPHDRHRRRDTRGAIGDAPVGRGILGVVHPRRPAAPARRHRRRPALGRLPAEPPADDDVPRRADPPARRRVREPLPDRQAGRERVHRRGRGAHAAPRRPGGGRDRERAPPRDRRRAGSVSSSR